MKAGASVNRKDVQGGFTPMHLAADAGQCEAMEALLRAGASLNPRSTQGWTPLGLATLKVMLTPMLPQGLTHESVPAVRLQFSMRLLCCCL